MNIQICIATGQPLANLIPILHHQPDRVVILVSDGMQAAAEEFRVNLIRRGWTADSIQMEPGLPSADFESIFFFAQAVQGRLQRDWPEATLVYNATGGNKLMALACYQVFAVKGCRILYTDTANNRLEVLYPEGQAAEPLDRGDLTLPLYLKAMGKTIRSREDTAEARVLLEARKAATKWLGRKADALGPLIAQLNYQMAPLRNDPHTRPVFRLRDTPRGLWADTLNALEAADLLSPVAGTPHEFAVHSQAAVRYLSGGWLEEYVWHCARDCGAHDVGLGVTFTDDQNAKADIRNEMDVLILHKHRLLLVECKSGRVEERATDILYKLDSLTKQTGGTMGTGLLVSVNSLDHRTREGRDVYGSARAESHDMLTCAGADLKHLKARIQDWMVK